MGDQLVYLFTEAVFIAISLGVSAFFSGAEVALTSISLARVTHLVFEAEDEHPLQDWLDHPNRYLTTLLVGNNISNIAGALVAGDLFRRLVSVFLPSYTKGPLAGGLAFLSMTFLVLVFGEILPKIYFRHRHQELAPRVIRPLGSLYRVLKIPIQFLMFIANGFIRLFGGEPSPEIAFVTAEDVKRLIEVGHKQGVLEQGEQEMLHSIFRLSETPVREVMTPRVEMAYMEEDWGLEEALATFEEHDFSRFPVIRDNRDNVIGVLYMKDLLHRWRGDNANGDVVKETMRPVFFIPESKRIDDVLEQFQKEKTHIAIVVDEYGGTEGLVTIEDVLEEIVGEIEDEFDDEEEPIHALSEGVWEADATVDLDVLEGRLDEGFAHEGDFESLAGFLLEIHGDLPKEGEEVAIDGFRFTIVDADERRISRVRIEAVPKEEAVSGDPEDPEED